MSTLHEVQQEIEHLVKEEWRSHYWSPLSNLARLTEELGELAREINHSHGEKPKKIDEPENTISKEIGDLLFTLALLANSLGVELDSAFTEVMIKYRQRDALRWQPTVEQ